MLQYSRIEDRSESFHRQRLHINVGWKEFGLGNDDCQLECCKCELELVWRFSNSRRVIARLPYTKRNVSILKGLGVRPLNMKDPTLNSNNVSWVLDDNSILCYATRRMKLTKESERVRSAGAIHMATGTWRWLYDSSKWNWNGEVVGANIIKGPSDDSQFYLIDTQF